MESENSSTSSNEDLVPRVRLDQVYRERNNLAILAAIFMGAYLEGVKQVIAPSEFVGWSVDPEAESGFETVVYLTPSTERQISFHMSPREAALARALLVPFTGEWDGTYRGRDEDVYRWLQVVRLEHMNG
ncbi:hypothetical protein P3T23_004503 [Paraburkholderia sp. GAS448]|jgi:hypothetical protein|uniref:hypothetical protein n=1 Tax=Paraburkholderia sp. GAS448 TaxID=3035136 RepID=UPI003D23B56F